jgi:HPt (histidine-containing phosphotransfer) domain-containing protein
MTPDLPSEEPVFDRNAFRELKSMLGADDDPEFLDGLVEDFIEDTRVLVRSIVRMREDRPAVRRAAHTLRSSTEMFGAVRLAKTALRIESSLRRSPESADWQHALDSLEEQFEAMRTALAAEIGLGEGDES